MKIEIVITVYIPVVAQSWCDDVYLPLAPWWRFLPK